MHRGTGRGVQARRAGGGAGGGQRAPAPAPAAAAAAAEAAGILEGGLATLLPLGSAVLEPDLNEGGGTKAKLRKRGKQKRCSIML